MKSIFKTLGAICLIIIAIVLFIITTPCAFVWRVVKSIKTKVFNTGISAYFVEIAASFDQLGNATFGGFFTWLFVRKDVTTFYSFGDKDETISEVLGWNEKMNSLSKTGKTLVWLLNILDKNHCKRAMDYGVGLAHKKIKYYNTIV